MSDGMKAFVDFLHENKDNPRIIKNSEKFFQMAHTLHEVESVGMRVDVDSVKEACRLIMEG